MSMDAGFISQAEATWQMPLPKFDDRNRHLSRLWKGFLNNQQAYDLRRQTAGHGKFPGTACKGSAAALYLASDSDPLTNLCQAELDGAITLCEVAPGPWPLEVQDKNLWAYQNEVAWDKLRDAQWCVGVAFGQLAFDWGGARLEANYASVAGPQFLPRADFSKIFAHAVFGHQAVLSQWARREVTFPYRLAIVEKVIADWS